MQEQVPSKTVEHLPFKSYHDKNNKTLKGHHQLSSFILNLITPAPQNLKQEVKFNCLNKPRSPFNLKTYGVIESQIKFQLQYSLTIPTQQVIAPSLAIISFIGWDYRCVETERHSPDIKVDPSRPNVPLVCCFPAFSLASRIFIYRPARPIKTALQPPWKTTDYKSDSAEIKQRKSIECNMFLASLWFLLKCALCEKDLFFHGGINRCVVRIFAFF